MFDDIKAADANYVRFRVGPEVVIGIGTRRKAPGEAMVGEDVELAAVDDTADDMTPYERLIGDAMNGRRQLFTRQDASELAWRVVDQVLDLNQQPAVYRARNVGAGGSHAGLRSARRLGRPETVRRSEHD